MRRLIGWLFAGLLLTSPAMAAQSNLWSPNTGTVSGLQLTNNYNAAFSALATCNSGSSAPANDISAVAVKGQCWLDSSVTPNILKIFDGASNWLTIGYLDAVNHIWTPAVGTGAVNTISSSGTTDLCSTSPAYVEISGTVTITSFGSNCIIGQTKWIRFQGALTLTHNGTSLFLPNNGGNIVTVANDTAHAVYLGSGNWRVLNYIPATGGSLQGASLTAADQALSGGANVTSFSLGTFSTGTQTVDCGKGPLQFFSNNGAFTLAAPANDGSCDLLDTNAASAGAITFSGFTVNANTGEALTNTSTNKFIIHVERINGTATYMIKALQ